MNEHITPGLAALMREAQAQFEDDARQASHEVAATAQRRRRRSGSFLGVGVLVGAMVLAGTAFGVAGGGSPAPSPSPLPSVSGPEDLSVPLASTVIPVEGGSAYDGLTSLLECGTPAPKPTGVVDHFAIALDEDGPLSLASAASQDISSSTINASIIYDSDEPTPVAQTPIFMMLVQDDVIQGYFWPDFAAQKYWTYSSEDPYYGGGSLMPDSTFCPNLSSSTQIDMQSGRIHPGTYQVIPIARVWADEEAAALKYLYMNGVEVISLQDGRPHGNLNPGSWDCKRFENTGQSTRSCLGDVTGSAIVDMDAGTVTLPYEPSELTRELDVTVVGEPVELHVGEDFVPPEVQFFEAKELNVGDPIECGTTLDATSPEPPVTLNGPIPRTFDSATTTLQTTVLPEDPRKGRLTFANTSKAWLVGDVNVAYEYFEDHPGNQVIIGVADVSLEGPNTIDIDRYTGPSLIDLVFTNVDMCEDLDTEGGFSYIIIDTEMTVAFEGESPEGPTHVLAPFYEQFS